MKLARFSREEFNRVARLIYLERQPAIDTLVREFSDLLMRRCTHDETLLHFFAVENEPEIVQLLAVNGASIDVENEFGNTALMECALLGNVPMLKLFCELGGNVKYQSILHGRTALHFAADSMKQEAYDFLISQGANPECRDKLGFDARMQC